MASRFFGFRGFRGFFGFWGCWLLLVLFCGMAARAQSFPPLTGRVVDAANLLTAADEATLSARLADLETRSRRQLVVATIADLQGYAIEDYGYRLGRAWAIGHKERNDGVLLIVAPHERKVRIEVGYGLEPVLTDALSATIISRDILPSFRDGNYAAGIIAGADSIARQLELPEEEARAIAAEAAREADTQGSDIPSILFWAFFITVFVLPTVLPLFGGGRAHRGGGGRPPVVIWGPGVGGWGRGGGFGRGGFSGGGGSFGGGGSSGSW